MKKSTIYEKPSTARIDFIGWEYYEKHKQALKRHIARSGLVTQDASPFLLEIRLVEKERYHLDYRFWNIIAFIYTSGLIPLYDGINHRLEFRLYKGVREEAICTYRLSNDQFSGILLLPLTPFFYPSSQQRDLFQKAYDLYRKGCAKN
ncbi:MAG: hypothetical protein AAF518_04590 [Spirochaetota bacterium]